MVTLVLVMLFSAEALPLRPFVTDGCTLAPDGTVRDPKKWRDCCVAHDLRLWGGGTKLQRDDADRKLALCIEEKANRTIARLYLAGVRAGSYSPYKIPSKVWGNAWYERSGYRLLPRGEVLQLLDELARIDVPEDIREEYRLELEARINP